MTQAHILYSGTVQGIGFRYTVQRYAQDLNLTGWVKNLADGRVEILVEGPQETIDELCQKIEQHFGPNIDDKRMDYLPAQNKFSDFGITF